MENLPPDAVEEIVTALVFKNRALKNALREVCDVLAGICGAPDMPPETSRSVLARLAELRRLT